VNTGPTTVVTTPRFGSMSTAKESIAVKRSSMKKPCATDVPEDYNEKAQLSG